MVHSLLLQWWQSRPYRVIWILVLLACPQVSPAQMVDSKIQQQQERLLSKKQQTELLVQQQQKALLEKQRLQLAEQEKHLLSIQYQQKQDEFTHQQKEQASLLQKNQLQAKYEASIKDKQISSQKESLSYNHRWIFFLLMLSLLVLVIAAIIFVNHRKTKRLSQLVLTKNRELEQVSLVKDRVLGVVGHDMRSPLNMLLSFSQLLKYGSVPPEKMEGYLNQLESTLHHTSSLMDNLLYWAASQMQGYKPAINKVMLTTVAADMLMLSQPMADGKEVHLTNTIPADIAVWADADMLALVLRNLVNNAIKFSPTGGKGKVSIGAARENEVVVITVTDNGAGMNERSRQEFNDTGMQYTGSTMGTGREKGMGLGLLLCKTFIQLMNGKIMVHQQEQLTGCTFKIVLPHA